jgi:hypothetical protein
VDHLPFYRQEKMFRRLWVDIGRATMGNWTMKTAKACQPLLNLFYGYRPGRSAHDALEVTKTQAWQYDWVVEIDIKALCNHVSHELILKALAYHKLGDAVCQTLAGSRDDRSPGEQGRAAEGNTARQSYQPTAG